MKTTNVNIFIILLAGLFVSSCSTLVNPRTVKINVSSDTDSVKIRVGNDSLQWHTLPANIDVERSKRDLIMVVQKDSIKKQLQIKSYLSTAFWLGNMFNGTGIIGYAVDLTNPKRFTYPKTISINLNDEKPYLEVKYAKWLNPQKHLLNIKLSIPEGNYLYLNKGYDYGDALGFLGISAGFEYYFSNKFCINMDFGGLTDFILPFPAPYDRDGNYNSSFATYGDLQIGSDYKRLHYDAGIQFTRSFYYERETVELFPEYIDTLKYAKVQNNFGLAFSAYYRVARYFNLGINYYPSFLVLESKQKFHYSHLLFFELSFRIEAYRPRKNK